MSGTPAPTRPEPVRVRVAPDPLPRDPTDAEPIEALPASPFEGRPPSDVTTATLLDMREYAPPSEPVFEDEPTLHEVSADLTPVPPPVLSRATPLPTAAVTLSYATPEGQRARLIELNEESLKVLQQLLTSVQTVSSENLSQTIDRAPTAWTALGRHICYQQALALTGRPWAATLAVAIIGGAVTGGTGGLVVVAGQWAPWLGKVVAALVEGP